MSNFTRIYRWYIALTKRLFKKATFLITLILIPLSAIAVSFMSQQESGVMSVGLYSENNEYDPIYEEIRDELKAEVSSIKYIEYDSLENIKHDVYYGNIDTAWVFKCDLETAIHAFVHDNQKMPFVDVYLRQDDPIHQLVREKLNGYLYKNFSFEIFVKFMESREFETSDDVLLEYKQLFDKQKNEISDNIIEIEFLNEPDKKIEDLNYVMSPLKGLFAVAVLICCLAAMMYSLEDEVDGKYSLFPLSRRLFLHFTSVSAAAVLVGFIVFVTRFFLGDVYNVPFEILSFLLYMAACVVFCTFIGIVCRKPERICIVFPVLIVACLTLSDIFFITPNNVYIKFLIPTTHYINTTENSIYLLYLAIYAVVLFVISCVLHALINKNRYKIKR